MFQSTRPRGARQRAGVPSGPEDCFNPRAHAGCVCQPDLAHFDTQIWPPCKTNNSRYFVPLLFSVAPAEAEPCAAAFAAR